MLDENNAMNGLPILSHKLEEKLMNRLLAATAMHAWRDHARITAIQQLEQPPFKHEPSYRFFDREWQPNFSVPKETESVYQCPCLGWDNVGSDLCRYPADFIARSAKGGYAATAGGHR